ncbi:tautomerase family protein [Microvirga sp. CF3016]|uniref:tautomerase family protein n=1 Tax=Microvirga sp. CF3016 TaxID=3110181 RepID=UPI002E784604|nr:tautomerase family protein [Microvirga sp. CF3016]MEE1610288.1 tautomerase family protein [Microvirga sp. CF3016]
MPATRIETRRGWIGDRRREVIEAVQRALQTGLRIPDHDRCVRLLEYDDDAMIAPPEKGPSYLIVEVTLFSGRSMEAKRELYASMAEELGSFGVPPSDIKIILIEVERENWGLRGIPASDIDLGYRIDV